MSEPTTEAGRRLLADLVEWEDREYGIAEHDESRRLFANAIAAIEAEARRLDRERIEARIIEATVFHHPLSEDDEEGWMIGRDAILAIVREQGEP